MRSKETATSGSGNVFRYTVHFPAHKLLTLYINFSADVTKGSRIWVGPNRIVFDSPKAYLDIYSHKANVKKSNMYAAWQRREEDINTLATTDVALHAKKRRRLNTVFTKESIISAASFVVKHVDRWNELSLPGDDRQWSQPINLTDWTDCLVFDILGDLCYGKSFEIKEPGGNPLKIMPHAIVRYMRFYYPVR